MKQFTIEPKASVYVYKEPVNMAASFPKLTSFAEVSKGQLSISELNQLVDYVVLHGKQSGLKMAV